MKNKSEIQSILFDKRKWSKADAIHWLKQHDYKYNKIDPGKGFIRFRQTTPNYPRYGELKWKGGINAVVGFRGAKPKGRKRNPKLSANEKRLRVSHGMQKAKESRLNFSQQDNVKKYNMNVQMPKAGDAVMMIGTAENLDYVSDKFDGQKRLYTHRLKKHGTILAVMPKSGDVVKTVIITDLSLHIRPEGLTG